MRHVLAAVLAAALAAGCAQIPLGPPAPSLDTIQRARASGIAPLALGAFGLASGRDTAVDQRVTVRSNRIFSPYGSSFAAYLRETFAAQLRAAGLLDPGSATVVSASLTDSELDVPNGPARAVLGAEFVVTRNGARVYAKQFRVTSEWLAPAVGVEAIPGAINRYEQLHRALVARLIDDPGFVSAAR